MTRKRRKTAKKQKLFCRKNLPLLGVTALFCTGIMTGAFTLNHFYTQHIEVTALAEAERQAAEQAQYALKQKIARLQQANQKNAQQVQPPKTKVQATPILTDALGSTKPTNAKFSRYTPPVNSHIIAIVIDDIGYKKHEGERTLAIDSKLTVAVLPFTPYAKFLATQAPNKGKEVMLHAPMEPKSLSYWGEGLKSNMGKAELRKSFNAMIDAIPNLAGVNNHMGSGLTENPEIMAWLMTELPKRGLYFVDSRTTAKSVALEAAQSLGVQTYERDIFLDHSRKPSDINYQLDRLIKAAQKTGMALGIGHPYPETLAVLEKRLPQLKAQGIELVTVSELLNAQANRVRLAQHDEGKNNQGNIN